MGASPTEEARVTVFDLLFYALHLPALAGWALLFLAPGSAATRRWVHGGRLIVLICLAYLGLLFCGVVLRMGASGAGMTSLAAIGALFSHPVGLLTGWAHFLAFDLFVGAWIARDARAAGFSHASTLPALLLTLMFGPTGVLWHLARRNRAGLATL
jgi:hypothetical protein